MDEKGFRYEQKYLIGAQTAFLLRYRLAAMMDADPHAVNGRYHIRSLYFDDAESTAFFSKLNGIDARSKFRIRHYGFDSSFISLEKKEKLGSLTRKTASRIDLQTANRLIADAQLSTGSDASSLLCEFFALRAAALLRPAVYVDYDRYPFVCAESHTRITIDANITAGDPGMEMFDSERLTVPVLPDGTAVLEIKFDDHLPSHLVRLMEDVPMQIQAVSKYCLCMDAIR